MADDHNMLNQVQNLQRRCLDYFMYQRQGNGDRWMAWEAQRQPIYNNYNVPMPGRWPGVQPEPQPVVPLHLQQDGELEEYTAPAEGGADVRPEALQNLRPQVQELRNYVGLEFNRILGSGGFGVAVLYDLTKAPHRGEQVVVKFQFNQARAVADERCWHRVCVYEKRARDNLLLT